MMAIQPVWAAGPPEPSPFNNPLAITLIVLMVLLLIIIGFLANILVGTADLKHKKRKYAKQVLGSLILMAISSSAFAQDAAAKATSTAKQLVGCLLLLFMYWQQ